MTRSTLLSHRTLAALWLALSVGSAGALWAQSPVADTAGAVAGTVIHGLTGDPIGDAEVAFLMSGPDGQLSEVVRKAVGDDGRFLFSGPFLASGQAFVLVAFYRDVPYPSGTLEVGQQSAVLLEVFDPTERDDRLVITGHHHFLSIDAGGVEVAQLIQMDNRSDSSFVGHGTGHDRHVTQFVLPAELVELENHNSSLHQSSPGRYFDTQPLVPGVTQIAFSFRLPADSFGDHYVHHVVYPTESVDFYVQPTTIQPGAPFEDLGPVEMHERQYRHLRLRDLVPGQAVRLPLPVERPIRWVIKWVVLTLGVVASAAAVVAVAGRSTANPAPPAAGAPSPRTPVAGSSAAGSAAASLSSARSAALGRRQLEARRRAVLDELAGLGDADTARREQLMAEAVSLYQALERGK